MIIEKIAVGILQANCYLLIDDNELAVVDPGDEARKIISEIEKTGAEVKFIINTHDHFDHIGANDQIAQKFGVKVLSELKEGDILTVGKSKLEVVKTPGHTPGGICLIGENFAISGDTLFEGNIGRTDLEGGSDRDMSASLKVIDKLISGGATVYPGHGESFQYKKGMALEFIDYLV